MNTETKLLVLAAIASSTVAGIILGLIFRKIPHRFNDTILGFAAGVMLGAAILGLLLPALSQDRPGALVLGVAGAFAGAALISVLDRAIPHLHRLAGMEPEKHNNRSISKILLFVFAIALHKIPEGLATGVSFGAESAGDMLTVASAMTLQNIPEAVVVVAPLLAIGVTAVRVVFISLCIAATSIVSVAAGMLLVGSFASITPFLTAAAGGAMLYVISDEMIPETHSHGHEKEATFALISGLVLVIVLQGLLESI